MYRELSSIAKALIIMWSTCSSAHTSLISPEELISRADTVAVVNVESLASRWNEMRTLILTDYQISIVSLLKNVGPVSTTISVPGGTIGPVTDWTCLSTPLDVGETYLIFLSNDPGLSPIVGSTLGIVKRGKNGEALGALALKLSGKIDEVHSPSFEELTEEVEKKISRTPIQQREQSTQLHVQGTGLPYKALSLGKESVVPGPTSMPLQSPLEYPDLVHSSESVNDETIINPPAIQSGVNAPSKFTWIGRPSPPIVFEAFPSDWSLSPYDQHMMSQWNTFGDVYRVYAESNDTWAYGNGVFELAGFPPDSQMIAQFGRPWGGELGVTFCRLRPNIVECDIAMNPAFSWTLDESVATDESSDVMGFRQTMLHELGHAWGLRHPWEHQDVFWDSVMNYSPKSFRIPLLRNDDTAAVRSAYPGVVIKDTAFALYSTDDDAYSSSPVYSPISFTDTVQQGQSLSVFGKYQIENTGSQTITETRVQWYLTSARHSLNNSTYLGSTTIRGSLGPHQFWRVTRGPIEVPLSAWPGLVFLAGRIASADDEWAQNNAGWSVSYFQLRVLSARTPLPLSSSFQVAYGGIRRQGYWDYDVQLWPRRSHTFSFCGSNGGVVAFDGLIELIASNGTIAMSTEAACGRELEYTYLGNVPAPVKLRIRGANSQEFGPYQFAYRATAIEVFASGFE